MDFHALYNYWYDRRGRKEEEEVDKTRRQYENEKGRQEEAFCQWRLKQRMKTLCGGLVVCLNLGIDPPDLIRPQPAAYVECWIDPSKASFSKEVLENIGKNLQSQYAFWQPRAKFRPCLDASLDDLKKLCAGLRRSAREDRVLFHYNGHGVPKPTLNGELWVFNKNYTQYLPCSIVELHGILSGQTGQMPGMQDSQGIPGTSMNAGNGGNLCMSGPVFYVFDCSHAGHLIDALNGLIKEASDRHMVHSMERLKVQNSDGASTNVSLTPEMLGGGPSTGGHSLPFLQRLFQPSPIPLVEPGSTGRLETSGVEGMSPGLTGSTTSIPWTQSPAPFLHSPNTGESMPDILAIGATDGATSLSLHPDMPADVLTSCLTTPIEMAIRWALLFQRSPLLPSSLTLDDALKMPGRLNDRKTPLGELHWILTAITDTIAWDVLVVQGQQGTECVRVFQRLFRQDILVAALFRNFLLAQRIMVMLGGIPDAPQVRTRRSAPPLGLPTSIPTLPDTSGHVLWETWDFALESTLSQIPLVARADGAGTCGTFVSGQFLTNPFFKDQLKAFEIRLMQFRRARRKTGDGDVSPVLPPPYLPIILQVLLSPLYRRTALSLLLYYFDEGRGAVQACLIVGLFAYLLKLLASPAPELCPLLIWLWRKLLLFDGEARKDLLKEDAFLYFVRKAMENDMSLTGAPNASATGTSSPPSATGTPLPVPVPVPVSVSVSVSVPLPVPVVESVPFSEFPLCSHWSFKELVDSAMHPSALLCVFLFVREDESACAILRAKQPLFIGALLQHLQIQVNYMHVWTVIFRLLLLAELVTGVDAPLLTKFLAKRSDLASNATDFRAEVILEKLAWLYFYHKMMHVLSAEKDLDTLLMHTISLLHDLSQLETLSTEPTAFLIDHIFSLIVVLYFEKLPHQRPKFQCIFHRLASQKTDATSGTSSFLLEALLKTMLMFNVTHRETPHVTMLLPFLLSETPTLIDPWRTYPWRRLLIHFYLDSFDAHFSTTHLPFFFHLPDI